MLTMSEQIRVIYDWVVCESIRYAQGRGAAEFRILWQTWLVCKHPVNYTFSPVRIVATSVYERTLNLISHVISSSLYIL